MITSFKRTTPDLLPRPQFMVLQLHRVPSTLLEVQLGQKVVDKREHGSWFSNFIVPSILLEVQLGQKVVDKRDHGSWLSNFTEFLQYSWRSNSDKRQWIKETMVHVSPTLQSSFNTTGSPTRIKAKCKMVIHGSPTSQSSFNTPGSPTRTKDDRQSGISPTTSRLYTRML